MSAGDREALLSRFNRWLDEALSSEDPPKGIAAEILAGSASPPGGDLYSVAAALTALTQEVKLQGRSFKQLTEAVEPVAQMAPGLASLSGEARLQARREVLDALLDLRDRLALGEDAARQAARRLRSKRPWWQTAAARDSAWAAEIVEALLKGYELTAARLREVLDSYGVREIDCLGRPFDPRSMHAVGVVQDGNAADGSVVDICRRGYEWNGEVYRPAHVRVARCADSGGQRPGAGGQGTDVHVFPGPKGDE